MTRILITGVNGFAGSHLARLLCKENKYEIFGIVSLNGELNLIKDLLNDIFIKSLDILDEKSLHDFIKLASPQYIYHFAAKISTQQSLENPVDIYKTNVWGTYNLLEAVKRINIRSKILIASSSHVYGNVSKTTLPITEDFPLKPITPYGVSKVVQELLAYQYAYNNEMLQVVVSRAFNSTGPGEKEYLVCSSIAKQIARIERGIADPVIFVGDLTCKRDIIDIRDMVKAYHILATIDNGCKGDIYNICRGESYSIKDLMGILLTFSNKKNIVIKSDSSHMKKNDIRDQYGSNQKLKMLCGWQPSIPIEQTLFDLLEYWRNKEG